MAYKIEWVGGVALGVRTEGGRSLAFSLEEGQRVPQEFKVDDEVEIINHPDHPASLAMGMNSGFYEIKHIGSGQVLKTWHRADEWKVK